MASATKKDLLASETLKMALNHIGANPTKKALDLGCGNGIDTYELLKNGWTVTAIDYNKSVINRLKKSLETQFPGRLEAQAIAFESAEFKSADLINASLSLPFCDPERFPGVWENIIKCLPVNGCFCGHFLGTTDSWARRKGMTFHSRNQVELLFKDFNIVHFEEVQKFGLSLTGIPKYWHIFHVVAIKTE